MALTDSRLKALSGKTHTNSNPIKHADRDGLNVFQYRTGKLSFVYRYRFGGKQFELKLGSYPAMSLAEARTKSLDCKRMQESGQDPKVQLRLNKEKLLEVVTVEMALEYWLENYARNNRANYQKHRAQFAKHVYPHIGSLPLEQCARRHWVKVFDDITKGTYYRPAPKASGYILQNAKQALRHCCNRGFASSLALEGLNIVDIGERQGEKDRVLSPVELSELWDWSQDTHNHWYYRNLTVFLIVFGCRTQEIRLSKVSEWDLESMIWTVPKENSKTGNEIKRPIPEGMKSYVSDLVALSKTGFLLGEEKRPECVSSYAHSISKNLNHEKWNFHDLRRTFATFLNDMQIEPYVVEQLLGHSLGGVMKIYNRSQHIEQKKAALELWFSKLTQSEQYSNVVGIR